MMDELMSRVFEALDEEKRIDTIILGFMAECNIDEDDIRFDSLKKNCYRKRTEIAEKLFLNNNSATAHVVLNLSFDTKLIR
jgi:CRISPR/Cas system-associated endoribonuclease Cas2